MGNNNFHKSFIMELGFVALVTIVSMISVRLLLVNYIPHIIKSTNIQYTNSQIIKD